MNRGLLLALMAASAPIAIATASAQDAEELSKQLQNPVASMISVPIQSNFQFRGGPDRDGFSSTSNIQPVIPVSLTRTGT